MADLNDPDLAIQPVATKSVPLRWLLSSICFFVGHDNETDKRGSYWIICRRCNRETPFTYFRRIRSLHITLAYKLVWVANQLVRGSRPGYYPQFRAIEQHIEGIGGKHSCGAYSYEHIESLIKQYKDDGLPEPLLKDLISEEGWIDLEEHPEMAEEVIKQLSKDLTLEQTRREQEELNRDV